MENKNSSPKIRALAKHIRMSAHKARRVINQIRSRSYEQALMILEFMPYRACYPILQLISSAAANANHNMGLNKANLFVSRAEVNEGAVLKRSRPRAQGRGYPIQKPTCHITIVLEEKDKSNNLIMLTETQKRKICMGQKMNPLGFRLGVTQNHRSHWFAQQKNYSEDLREDERIRNCIVNYVQRHMRSSSNHGGIARVEIRRKIDLIQVEIHIGFPNLLIESRGRGIEQLRTDVRNMLNSVDRKLNIAIVKVAKPYGEPNILAEFIALQLEDRVSLGRTVKKAIELAEQADIKGIQIQIAGRLDGNEIARVEWAREGRVPLQTIRAKIDYCYYPAQTIYGVLGIKIWIFRDER